ncbi:Adenosylhomocysteinase [Thelohanellus kitauei]|uniref:Adenosylhomocysteinase n=1 Tax=Thelohanellus kitauei TaxID=669202 RepID=A0A0C2NAE5_THEKT|nr:Adenosylhomocysteinase [Thelohanellus kitauei]
MEVYQVSVLDDVISDADIVLTATGSIRILTGEHIENMKNIVILGNTGHSDLEAGGDWIAKNAVSHITITPQVDKCTFNSGKSVILLAKGGLVNLRCAEGSPSFVISATFLNIFLAAIELYLNSSTKYLTGIHLLPKKVCHLLYRS